MNRNIFIFVFILASIFVGLPDIQGQQIEKTLNLEDVLNLAHEQSPQAMLARHTYRASYWEYRTYVGKYLPNLSLSATIPDINRSIESVVQPDGTEKFVSRNIMNNDASLNLSQNIGLTGGSIFMASDLARIDILGGGSNFAYSSTPISIGFSQPILKYNPMIWERRIAPLKYEEAKKSYLKSMEDVSLRAISLFFDLAASQLNLQTANFNYSNADTLYKIAKGRYNIGTIAENELLQMELSLLNAGTQQNEAKVDLELNKSRLRSFLGFNEMVEISLIIPTTIPNLTVPYEKAYAEAMENHPDILDLQRQLLVAKMNVAQAKAGKRLNMSLYASYGLSQTGSTLPQAYKSPLDGEKITLGINMPILDWGMRRGQYKMAQSNEEVVRTTVQQAQTDFQQNVFLQVMRFNLMDDQFYIAAKADTIAQLRYDVTKQRFLIGKIAVLDLNVAMQEKDNAQRGYINALRNYWNNFYTIRELTLYDFIADKPIQADLDMLLN